MTAFPLENAHIRRYKVAGLETQPIRRTVTGHIDMAYYLERSRRARTKMLYDAFARLRRALTGRRRARVGVRPDYAPCA